MIKWSSKCHPWLSSPCLLCYSCCGPKWREAQKEILLNQGVCFPVSLYIYIIRLDQNISKLFPTITVLLLNQTFFTACRVQITWTENILIIFIEIFNFSHKICFCSNDTNHLSDLGPWPFESMVKAYLCHGVNVDKWQTFSSKKIKLSFAAFLSCTVVQIHNYDFQIGW